MKKTTILLMLLLLTLTTIICVFALCSCNLFGNNAKLTVFYDNNHIVYENENLESLRPFLTVNYTDRDGKVDTVTDYTLSGILTVGECTITVRYNDSTKTFTVLVKKLNLQFAQYSDNSYIVVGMEGAEDTVVIPSTYNNMPVTGIGDSAFSRHYNLNNVIIGNNVTNIGEYAFNGCKLTNINYLGTIEGWCSISGLDNLMFEGYINKTLVIDGKKITDELIIPNTVTSISYGAFHGIKISRITIPFVGENANGVGETHFGYIFGASSYPNINNADYVPSTLNTVVITGGNNIGNVAFYGCQKLTSITIPDSVTTIGYNAFDGCSYLKDINYLGTIESWLKIDGLDNLMSYGSGMRKLLFNGKELTGTLVIPIQ